MPHTLSYCALIGKCALIRSNTVCDFCIPLADEELQEKLILEKPSDMRKSQFWDRSEYELLQFVSGV